MSIRSISTFSATRSSPGRSTRYTENGAQREQETVVSRASTEPLPGPPDPWVSSEMPRFRSRPPYVMTEMIAAEPALAQRLVRRLREQDATERLADAIKRAATKNRPVLLTGCGTSEHAAMAVAELLTEALQPAAGREVRAIAALEAL